MKTKNKTFAMVEIAVVLFSVFLVAIPAIAADQTTQKVSAFGVTADSELYEPGPLDVFGNANEDDTVDMRDTTYIKLVIFGKKPKTDLADANYDGKVSMLDLGQTKLIILGKEKRLTFIDMFGEAVTVNKPIKRLVNTGWMGVQVTRALGARDILVAVGGAFMKTHKIFYPEISKLPAVGTVPNCDYEMILSLKPDAVQTNIEYTLSKLDKKRIFEEKLPGIPLICLNMRQTEILQENVRTLGYILDRENEAEELAEWLGGYINIFNTRTEGLLEDEKPRFYFESDNEPYHAIASGSSYTRPVIWAGGRNVLDKIVGPDDPGYTWAINVDPEWVIEQNPEIIFIRGRTWSYPGGYETDDPSSFVAVREKILGLPELANVDAVKNKRVYIPDASLMAGPSNIISTAYMGRLLHPELFSDIDPEAIHQEYIDRFCYIDFDVGEHGVFFYPPYEEWK